MYPLCLYDIVHLCILVCLPKNSKYVILLVVQLLTGTDYNYKDFVLSTCMYIIMFPSLQFLCQSP